MDKILTSGFPDGFPNDAIYNICTIKSYSIIRKHL